MHDFKIKEGDTRPSLEAQLLDENREPRDLSGVESVNFHMEHVSTQETVVDASALITDEADGKVSYVWSDGDTSAVGRHNAEFELTYGGGETETFPNSGHIDVYITEQIA